MNMNKIFYQCFSENQKKYLVNKGHSILLVARHIKTNNIFWCFLITDKLEKDLKNWTDKI